MAACAALASYVGFQAHLKGEAESLGREYAAAQDLAGARVSALPRPVSPHNWTAVVEHEGRYRYTHVNLRRRDAPAAAAPDDGLIARIASHFQPAARAQWLSGTRFGATSEDTGLARAAWDAAGLSFYRWFAEFPVLYRIERGNPHVCVWFQDLRFIVPGREHVPFRYGACSKDGGPWQAFHLDSRQRIPAR